MYPEKINEIDKIISSYHAKTILALPSGSAIANMIYSNKATLIEVLSDNKKSLISIWFLMSKELEMNYKLIKVKEISQEKDFRRNNYVIDQKDFKSSLNSLHCDLL